MELAERNILEQLISRIISRSPVPEDSGHSRNTLKWMLHLVPDADAALRLAALGHDIERAYGNRRVRKSDYGTFDEYKAAHALNSAAILGEVLTEYGSEQALIDEVEVLVGKHEFGGTPRSDQLKWADSLSYFDNNLVQYALRHSQEEIVHRVEWGLRRLPEHLREIVHKMEFADSELVRLVLHEISKLK
ncbi:DUF4202 family protein [Thermodesulfobacteriota bacterium]